MGQSQEIAKQVENLETQIPDQLSDIQGAEDVLNKALARIPVAQNELRNLAEKAAADLMAQGKDAGKDLVQQKVTEVGGAFMDSFEKYSLSPEQQKLAIGALAAYLEVKVNKANETASIAVRNLGHGLGITAELGENAYSAGVQTNVGTLSVKGAGGWDEIPTVEAQSGGTSVKLDPKSGVDLSTSVGADGRAGVGVQIDNKPGLALAWHGEKIGAAAQTEIDGAASAAITAFEGRFAASASGNLRAGELDTASLEADLGKLTVDAAKVGDVYSGRLGIDLGNQSASVYGSGGQDVKPVFGARYGATIGGQTLNLAAEVGPSGVTTKASLDTSVATINASYNPQTGTVTTGVKRKF